MTTAPSTTAPSPLTGRSLLAGQEVTGNGAAVRAEDRATGAALEPGYSLLEVDQLGAATAAAQEAFPSYRALAPERRAAFLERIAQNIEDLGDALIVRAMAETGLPETRLRGERARTTGQLRLFADVVRRGDHHRVCIDPALPERTPQPRPDIRRRTVPLGPVAVFGASNFPLAFSTAGGDTASALAAGCPVIVKAHLAHPGTGELVGRAIADAVAACDLHPGVFSHVYGDGPGLGQALVADPAVRAVGFTGSRAAGLALMATAAARPVPIPVHAEMSSINPVLLLPGSLEQDLDALAGDYLRSVTGSSGQLCTAPGLLFLPTGAAGDAFVDAVRRALPELRGQTMLTAGIASAWAHGVQELESRDGVETVGRGQAGEGENAPAPTVLATTAGTFLRDELLHREIFGAASLIVRYSSPQELLAAVESLEGQLTATLHLTDADHEFAAALLPSLELTAGRLLVGGWPTGVEVGHAMVHGGPFPATSDPRSTSVGSLAIERFLRPVAYQGFPEALLPAPLREEEGRHLSRRVDGRLDPGRAGV